MNRVLSRFERGIDAIQARHPEMPRARVVRIRLVYHVLRQLVDHLEHFFGEQGISASAWGMLMMLYSTPEGRVNPSTLSDSLVQSRTHMTRVADELVAKGLVERVPSASDRRRIELSLTREGRRFIQRVMPLAWQDYGACLEILTPSEADVFERLLRKLSSHLEQIETGKPALQAHAGKQIKRT
jgi:MarR family transcriptional repressor of emrRAB